MDIAKQIRDMLSKHVDAETIEKWMNTPNPALGMDTPQFCISIGKGYAVIEMLEAALAGASTCC